MKQDKAIPSMPILDFDEYLKLHPYQDTRSFTKEDWETSMHERWKEQLPSIGVNDKLGIKNGGLYCKEQMIVSQSDPAGKTILFVRTSQEDGEAICTAVNETYGKGYNPAAMEELYKQLEKLSKMMAVACAVTTDEYRAIETALKNAKTIKK